MSDSESGYSYSSQGSNASVSDSSSEEDEEAINKKKENNVGFDTESESSKALLSELRRIRDLSRGMDDVLGRIRLMYGRNVSGEEARGEMDATSYTGERQREQRQPSSSIASSSSTRNKPVVSPRFLSMPPANDFFSHGLDNSGVTPNSYSVGGYNECIV